MLKSDGPYISNSTDADSDGIDSPEIEKKSLIDRQPILSNIASILGQVFTSLPVDLQSSHIDELFKCKSIPSISFFDLLMRFKTYGNIPDELQIAALMLMDKALRTRQFTSRSVVYKLYMTSLYLVAKLYNDSQIIGHPEFSRLSGIPKNDLLLLETTLLLDIFRCSLLIQEEEFLLYTQRLMRWSSF